MPGIIRSARFLPFAWLLAAGTCAFPTDKSDEVYVTVALAGPVVLEGEKIAAHARLWRRLGADSTELVNTRFDWTSGDPDIATVASVGPDSAEIAGFNAGTITITARAVAFDKADVATVPVRVADVLEIDDISPDTVLYGGKVTLAGVGIKNIFIATLGAGALLPDTFSHRGDPSGLDTMDFWVPPPSRTSDTLIVLAPGRLLFVPETTVVRPFDIYEPNDIVARAVDLDAPGPIPQLPFLRFYNPALFFEPPPRDSAFGVDWYRFIRTDIAQALTLVLVSAIVGDTATFTNYVADSVHWDPSPGGGHIPDPDWLIGPGEYLCRSWFWGADQAAADSVIVALRLLDDRAFDVITFYSRPGAYALAVLQGYQSALAPDRFEENDACPFADAKFLLPATQIVVAPGGTFGDSLTIDNPFEIDWIKFRITGTSLVTIRTAHRAGAAAVATDIDLGLVGVDGTFYGYSNLAGSSEAIAIALTPGDYYAVVTDYLGQPLRYSLCIGSGVDCAPPAAAPSGGPALTKPSRAPFVGPASELRRRLSRPR